MFVEEKTQGETHVPVKLEDWQLLLLRAAALIEEYGHAKDDLGSPSVGFCALGALHYADCGNSSRSFKRTDGYSAWSELTKAVGGNIPYWNNAKARTKDEVISKMRAVALGNAD